MSQGDKEILRRVLDDEIFCSRYWCLSFAWMGSRMCQRIADANGWHKGAWKEELTPEKRAKAKAEKQREKNRAYRAAHREELNVKARSYRERLRAELREAKEAAEQNAIKQDLQKRKACLAEIEAEREERKKKAKQKRNECSRKWAVTHRDKVHAICKKYYERHREEIKAKVLQRYYANHEEELKVRALRRRKEAERL